MNVTSHDRAEELLLAELVEGISRTDDEWLRRHLESCPACDARSRALREMLRGLKSCQVQVSPELIRSTRRVVHERARELKGSRSGSWVLWGAAAASWAWILWSAPWLWKCLEWMGNFLGLPRWAWQMAFGMWWLLPALAAAMVLGMHQEEQSLAAESGHRSPM